MSTSNRYLLSECDLGQLSTLDESKEKKTILWWMVWQALGASVKVPTESHHVRAILEGSDGWISSWRVDEDAPALCIGDHDARPSLEAVLDALDGHPEELWLNIPGKKIVSFHDGEWTPEQEAETRYLAACRTLLLWKRGQA